MIVAELDCVVKVAESMGRMSATLLGPRDRGIATSMLGAAVEGVCEHFQLNINEVLDVAIAAFNKGETMAIEEGLNRS